MRWKKHLKISYSVCIHMNTNSKYNTLPVLLSYHMYFEGAYKNIIAYAKYR